jgi:hypothetical protein
MSVHGEFSRTLEGVIDVLRSSHEPPEADAWRKALEEARLDTQPDLSSAARAALAIVDGLNAPPERVAILAEHLARHCRVILGLPEP